MPGFSSHTALVNRSTKLLDALANNADQVQAVEGLRVQFEQAVAQYRTLIARRDTFKAEKQVLSRQLLDESQRVSDLGIDLKAALKANLGSRSEKLTEFDIKPRRKVLVSDRPKPSPSAKRKKAAQAQPEAPPTAEAQPATEASR